MTDENKLYADRERGARAEALLRSEMLTEAFVALDAAYVRAWRATNINDTNARERLFQAVHIVGKVRDHLTLVVSNGRLAQHELAQITDAQECDRPRIIT